MLQTITVASTIGSFQLNFAIKDFFHPNLKNNSINKKFDVSLFKFKKVSSILKFSPLKLLSMALNILCKCIRSIKRISQENNKDGHIEIEFFISENHPY